jgi:hypothetical protein
MMMWMKLARLLRELGRFHVPLFCVLVGLAACGEDSNPVRTVDNPQQRMEEGVAGLVAFGEQSLTTPEAQLLQSEQMGQLLALVPLPIDLSLPIAALELPGVPPIVPQTIEKLIPGHSPRIAQPPPFGTYDRNVESTAEPLPGWVLVEAGNPADGYVFGFDLDDDFYYLDDMGMPVPIQGEVRLLDIRTHDNGTPSLPDDDFLTAIVIEVAASDTEGEAPKLARLNLGVTVEQEQQLVRIRIGDTNANSPDDSNAAFFGPLVFAVDLSVTPLGATAAVQLFDSVGSYALRATLGLVGTLETEEFESDRRAEQSTVLDYAGSRQLHVAAASRGLGPGRRRLRFGDAERCALGDVLGRHERGARRSRRGRRARRNLHQHRRHVRRQPGRADQPLRRSHCVAGGRRTDTRHRPVGKRELIRAVGRVSGAPKSKRKNEMKRRPLIASTLLGLVIWVGCADHSGEHHDATNEDGPAAAKASHEDSAAQTTDGSDHGESGSAEQDALHKPQPAGSYGAGIHLKEAVALAAIVDNPAEYEGRIVQVSGTVNEVCPRRGCWIDLADGKKALRVKVTDGEIVFPLSAEGHEAVVEGIVEKIELNEEQHRAWKAHEAEERGEEFDPASVAGPMAIWRLQGLGARIDG